MDAMMTAKGSVWDPPDQVVEDCTREIDEVVRYLTFFARLRVIFDHSLPGVASFGGPEAYSYI